MGRKLIQIDRDKLRGAVRKLGNEYVYYMLDDAIELLPPADHLRRTSSEGVAMHREDDRAEHLSRLSRW